jgi:hypothetical protein
MRRRDSVVAYFAWLTAYKRAQTACPDSGARARAIVFKKFPFLRSAKGAGARRETASELANPSRGASDAASVLRVFLNNAVPFT